MMFFFFDNIEEWRDIAGYEDMYQVSSLGNIRSVSRTIMRKDNRIYFCKGKVLAFFTGTTTPYLEVQLSKENCPSKYLVHRVVAQAFLKNYSSILEVNHKNGNTYDNRVCNLEMVTHLENIHHAIKSGLTCQKGGNSVRALLSNEQAEYVRMLVLCGAKQNKIAQRLGVSKQTINNIVHYKTYVV